MPTNASKAPIPPLVCGIVQECHHSDPTTHSTALCHMTKPQLLAMAKERGLTNVKPALRKADLIELLEEDGA